jgi:hypothetical protein
MYGTVTCGSTGGEYKSGTEVQGERARHREKQGAADPVEQQWWGDTIAWRLEWFLREAAANRQRQLVALKLEGRDAGVQAARAESVGFVPGDGELPPLGHFAGQVLGQTGKGEVAMIMVNPPNAVALAPRVHRRDPPRPTIPPHRARRC